MPPLLLMFSHNLNLSEYASTPIWAYLDISTDKINWQTIEHWERLYDTDPEICIDDKIYYNLEEIIDFTSVDSIWLRFWFNYPNNDGGMSEWFIDNITTYGCVGIETEISLGNLPEAYKLEQNYPNPFNPNTTIRFETPITTNVSLNIYNIKGQLVRRLFNETLNAGRHTIHWDGKDNNEKELSSGIYLYRLEAEDYNITNSMLLLK